MFSYENGLIAALLIWIAIIILNIAKSNSQMQKNLNKIGKRIGFWGVVDIDYSKQSFLYKSAKFILIHVILPIPFLFLSWLYVALVAAQYIYTLREDVGAPQLVKEFRWKLRNMDLSFDELIKETMIAKGQDLRDFDKVKAEYQEYLRIKKAP